ncbi:hypothetical protein S1361_20130 [Streptomyces cyanogenus]|uniref:Uncharacterized protein n=1 Tax=Streptomyces cyanogenus TaxID=80860 RepID=A0ABX7TSR6_STRCY|nr:hypothetical protein S1361_20130 [Streptomyces cyanogenus]
MSKGALSGVSLYRSWMTPAKAEEGRVLPG